MRVRLYQTNFKTMSVEETEIAVLSEKLKSQDEKACLVMKNLENIMDKGFKVMADKFDNFIISNNGKMKMVDDRITNLEKRVDERIKECDCKYEEYQKALNELITNQKLLALKVSIMVSVLVVIIQRVLAYYV